MKRLNTVLYEGAFTNGFFNNRFNRNKNILIATTGSTGSGKSYANLRIAELWYAKKFNKPFPIENVTFSNGETMKILSQGKLEKGELLVPEEVGVNLGSLDFQSKTSKMFIYLLQSFRSMNVGLLMNLPVLTMLNKSARQLIHLHLMTCSIDAGKKLCKIKPLVHQLNQSSGKSYWKFPRVKIGKRMVALERISLGLPSKELIDAYEKKKAKFLSEMTIDFSKEYEKLENDKIKKMARNDLTEKQLEVYNMIQNGLNVKQIAEKQQINVRSVYRMIELIEKKGYALEIRRIPLENDIFGSQKTIERPFKLKLPQEDKDLVSVVQ
jgi:hypothetical protein